MIKYTVRLLLWEKDPNPQGHYPIYLCITVSRIRRYITTGIYVAAKYWDAARECVKEGHKMQQVYNPDLTHRKQKAIGIIVQAQLKNEPITADRVKVLLSHTTDLTNIFQFVDSFIEECRGKKKDSTLENYRKHALRLELFHGSRELSFEEITPEFLGRYESHLRAPADGGQPVGGNYVFVLWQTLKSFFNAARDGFPFEQPIRMAERK